jgi:4-aminobutyrate aminotransferase
MEKSRLGEKAVEKGDYIMKRLNELKDDHPLIGDVRGIGLMIGAELVEENKIPAAQKRDIIVKKALDGGLILLPAGDSVIRFVPPLIISRNEIDKGLEIFEEALKGVQDL